MTSAGGPSRVAIAIVATMVLAAALFVIRSLRRPEPPTFAPTAAAPAEVGAQRVGPLRVTIDARTPEAWRYFDFSRGAVVEPTDPLGWDLAVRRFDLMVNGGPGFAGAGGALVLGDSALGDVARLPRDRYEATARDSTHAAFDHWYDYGFTTHLLTPKPRVFAVRTADGRYAALRILSYYCPGAQPGCLTFEYVYDGRAP